MNISNLKFKQISSTIGERLTLDLFSEQNALFHPRSPTPLGRPKSRPPTGRDRGAYHNYHYTSASHRKQPPPEDCIFHLEKSLRGYIAFISPDERRSIRRDMVRLLGLLRTEGSEGTADVEDLVVLCQDLEGELSKKFKNRLVHLTFYLLFTRVCSMGKERQVEREIRSLIMCEYYGRKFDFKELTLSICGEIQNMYCLSKHYEQSRSYARKCLRLAVILEDEYAENKMIENLSILNYYEGRLNQESSPLLSSQERRRILDNYSEEKEMPLVFNFEKGPDTEEQEFSVEQHNNFIENSVPNQNVKHFQAHYHEIVKAMPARNLNVRQITTKVAEVGLVRKYFARDNFITIRPQCHILKPTHQEQVLITHKKIPRPHPPHAHTTQKAMRRLTSFLEATIAACATPKHS